ncbi:MAG: glycosyltransferase family 4 protein [Nitrospira sp.]|nr:glycosyltransferase family 4 protein [Nitrospira sp.]
MIRAAILNAFNPELYKGGIETFILNLKALLEEHNISVYIHSISPEPNLPIRPFPLESFNKIVPAFLLNCFMMGRAFSRIEKDYDFVITNNFYGLGYFSPRIKSFAIYHSTHAGYADALKDWVSKKDYRNLKYFYGHLGDRLSGRGKIKIAVSQSVKDELEKHYKFKNVTVINHGIDTTFFKKIEETTPLRKKWDIHADAFVGIFAGRWEIGKGIDIIEEVIKLYPDIIWLLAIGLSECPLKGNNIRVIKDADRETLRELYSISDFMLLPSYYEGFGLVIIEAMACKLPVICTEVGVAKDLFRFDALRRLILPNCGKLELIKKINDRISFLKRDEIGKKEIINRGRTIIERDYNIDIWKKRMSIVLGLSNY